MDLFIRQLPPHATQREVSSRLHGILSDLGIDTYSVEKRAGKTFGKLSILDTYAAQQFLYWYGVPRGVPPYVQPLRPLTMGRSVLRICEDKDAMSEHALRALEFEASQRAAEAASRSRGVRDHSSKPSHFEITALMCGVWDYFDGHLAFTPFFADGRTGTVTFGTQQAVIQLHNSPIDEQRIYYSYHDIENIVLGTYDSPTITFQLRVAPNFYANSKADDLGAALAAMSLGGGASPNEEKKKKLRLTCLNEAHSKVVSTCFVYQVRLQDRFRISDLRSMLNRNQRLPASTSLSTPLMHPTEQLTRSFVRLNHDMTDQHRYGHLPYTLLFQIAALADNGILHPLKVRALLPHIDKLRQTRKLETILQTLRRFAAQVPSAGPGTDANSVSTQALKDLLTDIADSYDRHAQDPEDPYQVARRYQHINLVHKIVVTPTGTYLRGPYPEPTNRVLRRYEDHIDHFVRTVFQDEDGAPVRYDPRADQRHVYERFTAILDQTVIVAGRPFSFLGFSHSSLRAQSVWCMSPFVLDGTLQLPEHILRALGNFSNIRVPAKCAARIGQNFTDTNATVVLKPHHIGALPMIQRNGRDFSDGVGTISEELLWMVWEVYGIRRSLKPTLLQIRFQGCKGMVSLDPSLKGKRLMLRENMKKFDAPSAWYLEICGAGFRPLPMILNRGLIKVLEDLGVQRSAFIKLQKAAVDELRLMTSSAINTAHFLETEHASRATTAPYLIRKLGQIGLEYKQDSFLYRVVEMSVITKLRDIKYRGRIPVKQGVTLYGIMDETGVLRENEIYVTTESAPQGGRWELIQDNVAVTRSPVMHPGDVQVVNAVSLPSSSPLKELRNAVVFSKFGARDLPSQLSGGDLDGDLYNIIWDRELVPATTQTPADYPRVSAVELGRAVTRKDMSDFFVKFMQTDQLGMLANIHLQLSDQRDLGTLDPDCKKLAQMASTGVDFSKTGVAVDMRECPKYDRIRPDFMAPSPRVFTEGDGPIQFEAPTAQDEALQDLEVEVSPMRYYKSQKALGHLYREIDEQQFVLTMQQQHEDLLCNVASTTSLPEKLLEYMLRQARNYGLLFEHYMDLAGEIKAGYEDSILDLLYQHGPSSHQPATEYEAFAGCILGRRGGAQGKSLRELSKALRERFESVCEYTTYRIKTGDKDVTDHGLNMLYDDADLEREVEGLPRAIACLKVALEGQGTYDRRLGKLQSFKYIAAGLCLKEFERYLISMVGSSFLPLY